MNDDLLIQRLKAENQYLMGCIDVLKMERESAKAEREFLRAQIKDGRYNMDKQQIENLKYRVIKLQDENAQLAAAVNAATFLLGQR